MLDKSVQYVPIVMRRDRGAALPDYALPEGFRFVYYASGDEKEWARIETSVLEFKSEMDALLYFQREFMSRLSELPFRCLFIETEGGEKVATASAWWTYTGIRRDPIVHWVAVKPEYQGRGLGKAVTAQVIRRMLEIEGDRAFYLGTQTWSHKAVGIYKQCGFYITDEPGALGKENTRSAEAIEVLNSINL